MNSRQLEIANAALKYIYSKNGKINMDQWSHCDAIQNEDIQTTSHILDILNERGYVNVTSNRYWISLTEKGYEAAEVKIETVTYRERRIREKSNTAINVLGSSNVIAGGNSNIDQSSRLSSIQETKATNKQVTLKVISMICGIVGGIIAIVWYIFDIWKRN
jgi:hypothetical protein